MKDATKRISNGSTWSITLALGSMAFFNFFALSCNKIEACRPGTALLSISCSPEKIPQSFEVSFRRSETDQWTSLAPVDSVCPTTKVEVRLAPYDGGSAEARVVAVTSSGERSEPSFAKFKLSDGCVAISAEAFKSDGDQPTNCIEGGDCLPPGMPCQIGNWNCSASARVCVAQAATRSDGASCGIDRVCKSGACGICIAQSDCIIESLPCKAGKISCDSGEPVCQAAGNIIDGKACGAQLVCQNGQCLPCVDGGTCTSDDGCKEGKLNCVETPPKCVAQTKAVVDGSNCGLGKVCSKGLCSECAAGATCLLPDPCKVGETDCGAGEPICKAKGFAQNGKACGNNMVCSSGVCTACVTGAQCVPSSNPCHQGGLVCSGEAPACQDKVTILSDGARCGVDQFCNKGTCSTCVENVECHPGGDLCKAGKTACGTGSSTCIGTGDSSAGSSCGSGLMCSAGTCVACPSGSDCDKKPPTATISPANGARGVAAGEVFIVTFNEAMDKAATQAAFQSPELPSAAVSFTFNQAGTVLTIRPNSPLAYAAGNGISLVAKSYSVTIGPGATDLAGNSLVAPVTATVFTLRRMNLQLPAIGALTGNVVRPPFGTGNYLSGSNIKAGQLDYGGIFAQAYGLVTFDISSIPAATIETSAATVNLYSTSNDGESFYPGSSVALTLKHKIFSALDKAALDAPEDASTDLFVGLPSAALRTWNALDSMKSDLANRDQRLNRSQYQIEFFPTATDVLNFANSGTQAPFMLSTVLAP